jgi:hypothetical protein
MGITSTVAGAAAIRNQSSRASSSRSRPSWLTLAGDRVTFFSLLEHITRSNVEMTAPVVSTYDPKMVAQPVERGTMTTEFLYSSPTLGQAGKGIGRVEVVDHPEATFVCLGLQGRISDDTIRESVARLRGWLAEHQDEWTEAGPPRRLGYHGPDTPLPQRLWEVHLPIQAASAQGNGVGPDRDR